MILFLDTEFTSLDEPDLISIGLSSEDGGHEFYAERTDFDRLDCSEFVRAAVLPKLGRPMGVPGGTLNWAALGATLWEWLAQIQIEHGDVRVAFDYPADQELMVSALDGDVPPGVTFQNIAYFLNWSGCTRKDRGTDVNWHHSLWDARALREDWQAAGGLNTWQAWEDVMRKME